MQMKNLKKLSIILVLFCCMVMLKNNLSSATTLSSDINGINENKYPGVKNLIQNLQRNHRNYNFQVYYTGIDWTEAVTMEYQGHGSSPKNLFGVSNKYKGKWYCPICGSKTYDTGWCCASKEAIEYMMDPRNSLDETSVFQFKNLEASDVSSENIQTVINHKYGSFGYINNPTAINAIVKASSNYKMNGYSILAKIVNEQGRGTSPLATGSGYNGQYIGYYNFFNVGAYGNGTSTVITNGLKYAQKKCWNSVENSILGGSEYYKSSYIGRGQNTLYYQRFNVVHQASLFSHQYQQDIMGAQTSATLLKDYYTISSTISSVNHTFIIPLYENMPATACSRPSTTENQQLDLEEATVLTNKLAVKASPNSSRIISYLNKDEKVRVLTRTKKVSSDGNYWDTIVSNTDGTYGYVMRSGITQKLSLPKYVFDSQYYANANSDIKSAFGYDEQKLIKHFIDYGIKEGRASSPTFWVKYYLEANNDVKAAYGKTNYQAAYEHFVNYGCKEYRRTSEEYDGFFYRNYYSDMNNLSATKLMEHYLNTGKKAGRIGALETTTEKVIFDANVYATCNSDIKAAYGNNYEKLKMHWLKYGISEGRIASIIYQPDMYSTLNVDIKNAFGKNYKMLFEHFIKCGMNEGRATSLIFDATVYAQINGDVKSAFKTNYKKIYEHFANYGIKEGRQASYVFDVRTYINSNGDIKAAYGNKYKSAMIHFINYGIHEPRKTSATFNVAYYSSHYGDLKAAYNKNYREYYIHYLMYGRAEKRKAV